MFKVVCPRCCNSKGVIDAYSHVKGGVCFKCNGVGWIYRKTKPHPMRSWRVGAENLNNDHALDYKIEWVVFPIFQIKAKSEKEALRKAKAKLIRSQAYDADTVFVVPVDISNPVGVSSGV